MFRHAVTWCEKGAEVKHQGNAEKKQTKDKAISRPRWEMWLGG